MSESGSRYKIIQELTDKKLDLIERKQRLKNKVSELLQQLTHEQQEYVQWQKTLELETKAQEQRYVNSIERVRQQIEDFEKDIANRESSIDVQIVEIDKALQSIKDISKESSGAKE